MTTLTTNAPLAPLAKPAQSATRLIKTLRLRLTRALHIPAILPSKHWIG